MKTRITVLFAFCSLLAWSAAAQDLATIVGSVTDPSGAAIPGAKVTVSNTDKGFTRKLVSGTDGEYIAARVPIGNYVVMGEAPGFQKLTRTGITLDAGQTQRVDLQMVVGGTTQQVTVTGNVPKVETETGAISHVVTGSQVSQLNLNSRNFANLALLVPGAAPGGYDPTTVGVIAGSTLPFNGLPGNFINWEIDSTNNVDQGSGSDSLMLFPNLDSIAEFRISSSNYSAEYGKSASANIEVVTKSGTRQFHGTVFEFVRNDKFDANDWFINRTIAPEGGNAPKTPVKRNNWGFTVGGPFFIPGRYNTSRQKTFFFVSEEWRRNREGTVIDQAVPSLRMRQGDFSECDPTSSNYNVVVASGCKLPTDPVSGAMLTSVAVDPTAKSLLDGLVPLPNNGVIRYTRAPSLPVDFREDMFRIDQNITEKVRIFFRYTQDAYQQMFVPSLWSYANFGTVKSRWTSPAKSAVLHLTQTIRPSILNEFIMSISADVNTVNNFSGFDSPAGSIDKPSGFAARTIFPGNQAQPKLPGIAVGGGVPFNFGESTGFEFFFWDPQPAVKDNLVWTHGKHTTKFGFFWLHNQINTTTNIGYNTQGFLTFSDSAAVSTGNALADMFLGRIGQYEEYGKVVNGQLFGGAALGHWRQWDFEPYAQDDWKVSPRLTLNLGVRYYYLTPFYDSVTPTHDSVFDPGQYNPANQAQLDVNGNIIQGSGADYLNFGNGLLECGSGSVSKGCYQSYHGTFSPRFGFSYDPTGKGKSAIRAGYAMTWDSSNPLHAGAGFNGNPPTATDLFTYNVVGFAKIGPGPIGPAGFSNVPRHQKWPQIHQFSLGVQHEFPGNNLLSVSYVGTLGRHLQRRRNLDQVPVGMGTVNVPALAGQPGCDASGNCDVQNTLINTLQPSIFFVPYRGYNGITQRELTGVSHYDSLQLNYRHPFGHGLTFQTAYTWSHTLDDLIGGGGTGSSSNGVNDYDLRRWRGTSSLNQTHVLVMNYVYNLPFFSNASNGFVRQTLGGWQINGIASFTTGRPMDLTCGIAGMQTGIGGSAVCNSLGTFGKKKGTTIDPQFGSVPTWFDPGTLGQVTLAQLRADGEPGMFGYMGKNPITGPGRNNWDLALAKNFQIPWFQGEHSSIQFRWETFNTFNHPQWSGINLFCSGQTPPGGPCNDSNNIGNAEVSSAYPPRIMQFGLKFIF
jgi:hypothetical protein